MLKKIMLGIIIGAVLLTAGAGGIYAFQKNSDAADEFAVIKSQSYVISSINSNFAGIESKQLRLQQQKRDQSNCFKKGCQKQYCANENFTEQYCYRENNFYRHNDDKKGCQNRDNFCYKNNNENRNCNENCLQNGKNGTLDNTVKNNAGNNK